MRDRYRVTLTMKDGALLTLECWDEAEAINWAQHMARQTKEVVGRLVEKIVTLHLE